jgi:hypothetical protein
MIEIQDSYLFGRLHENLLQVRNDLHVGDSKAALAKINDAIKLIEEKVQLIPEFKEVGE